MRKTTNYELNIAEGSDRYNHLTIDNPNYEKIDTTMKENENGAVQTATELKSGTVHAITRNKPNASMFRFVATSDYTSGETFTVDGQQVTALLPNGATLGTGAYHINANVLCCLVGTNMTVYTVGAAENIDATTLDGHGIDYFATADALNDVRQTATSAGIIANSAFNKVNKLVRVKVWENANPTGTFEGMTFNFPKDDTINLVEFDYIESLDTGVVLSSIFFIDTSSSICSIWGDGAVTRTVSVTKDSLSVSALFGYGKGYKPQTIIPKALYKLIIQ